jgi:hypothetical protein
MEKEKAEATVREKLPELMELSFGCVVVHLSEEFREPQNLCTVIGTDLMAGSGKLKLQEADGFVDYTIIEELKIIGHPIQLQHWLRVLGTHKTWLFLDIDTLVVFDDPEYDVQLMKFDLTTGQPDSEADYKAFNDIVI